MNGYNLSENPKGGRGNMMKHWKKISAVLVIILAVSVMLVGCGGPSTSNNTGPTGSSNVELKKQLLSISEDILAGDIQTWLNASGESYLEAAISYEQKYKLVDPFKAKMDLINAARSFGYELMSDWKAFISSEENMDTTLIIMNKACDKYWSKEQCERAKSFYNLYVALHNLNIATSKDAPHVYIGFEDGTLIEGSLFVDDKSPADGGYNPTKRPWYKEAISHKGQTIYSEPYMDYQLHIPVVTIAKTVNVDGETVGVAGVDLTLARISGFMESAVLQSGGKTVAFPILYAQNSVIIGHPNKSYIGYPLDIKAVSNTDEEFLKAVQEQKNQLGITEERAKQMAEEWKKIQEAKTGDWIEGRDPNGEYYMRIVKFKNGWVLGMKVYKSYLNK